MSLSLKHEPSYLCYKLIYTYTLYKAPSPHSYSPQPFAYYASVASVYMSNTVVSDSRLPLHRPTYKWPESEAEFVKMVSSKKGRDYDSISCRQMYLRSYTFSRKEEGVKGKTVKYLRVCAKNVTNLKGRVKIDFNMLTRVKHVSCAAFFSVFHRLLSCSSKVDEVDHHHGPLF